MNEKKKSNVVIEKIKGAGRVVADVGKISVAVVAAAATAELGFLGMNMLSSDAELVKDGVKHKIDPEPVYTRKGLFGKKEKSTINPWNGKVESYKGDKTPKTKKVFRV